MRVSKNLARAALVVAALPTGLAGCAADGSYAGIPADRAIGATIGAIAGGALGTQIGDGHGRRVAMIAGSILGAAVGAGIADRISRQDQQIHDHTAQKALDTYQPGQPATWSNPSTGVHGTVVPTTPVYQDRVIVEQPVYQPQTQTVYGAPLPAPQHVDVYGNPIPQQPVYTQQAQTVVRECRNMDSIIHVDNQPIHHKVKACRNPHTGAWEAVEVVS